MPTSHWRQINEIMDIVVKIKPTSVLDIGVGFGKYGFLTREFLDIYEQIDETNPDAEFNMNWTTRIDGIEVHEKYITPLTRMIYDHIYIGDAAEVIPTLETRYDLVMVIDVIEHFTHEDGSKLIENIQKIADSILIVTPVVMHEQHAIYGNVHETHRFQWDRKTLSEFGQTFFLDHKMSYLCVIGDAAGRLKKKMFKGNRMTLRDKIQQRYPALFRFYLAHIRRKKKKKTPVSHTASETES